MTQAIPLQIPLQIMRLPHAADLALPAYATEQSAGMDLLAAVETDTILAPMQRMLVPTGIAIALPAGYEAQVRARSGLTIKNGLCVLNGPGTVDADYRGEIKVILANMGSEPFVITRGMRIAQLVIATYTRINWQEVPELSASTRGAGGFGSTGT
ncbi:MAG: dUTP diphosphatase [Alphaproteobacteria bacterium]|nr:dUTP diphosphatase [Alphaproteobacteria bacterium]